MSERVSAIILTKNEEVFIERCIRSVRWADEIVVMDSGSSDRTCEIARSLGAVVYEREWLGWPRQKNLAMSLAKNDWVFCLDADEIVTPKLAESIQSALTGSPDPRDGYHVARPNEMLGALLANEARPSKQIGFVRLVNRTCNRYGEDQQVHEEIHPVGKALPLVGDLIHWRGYTMDQHLLSYNKYATLEARVWGDAGFRATPLKIFAKPILRFLWCYVYKQGYRRGTPGLLHAMTKASWEMMWMAKLWERQNMSGPALHPPANLYCDAPAGTARLTSLETSL